jgi:type I restriction enzyme, S subunit
MIHNLKPYPKYKESGVPWLGKVPEHWEVGKLRNVLRSTTQRNRPDLPLLSVVREKGVILRDITSKDENHNFVPDDLTNYKVVREGQFAMNKMKAWQGSYGVSRYSGIVSPAYFVFDIREVNTAYFHIAIRSQAYVPFFAMASDGVRIGQWDLSQPQMKEIPFAVPLRAEQSAIVRYLDYMDRRIGRYIRAKNKLIKLLNEQERAIIHQAVTRGLDLSVPLKPSSIPWLGDIPQHWELRRAKQACSAIIDCKNRTPELVLSGEFTVVRTTNIRNGNFNLAGSYTTDKQNYEIWTQRGAPGLGDVFFTREAPIGEACLVPEQANLCMGQRMMYFRPNAHVLDAEFLLYNIYGPVGRRYIEIESNGSTVGHLRLGQVTNIGKPPALPGDSQSLTFSGLQG